MNDKELDTLFPTILPYEHTEEAKQMKQSYADKKQFERDLWNEVFHREYVDKDHTATFAADIATEVVEKFRKI